MAFIRSFSRGDPGIGSWLKKAARIVMPVASIAASKMGRSIGASVLPGGFGKVSSLLSSGGMWQGKSRTELMDAATSFAGGTLMGGLKQLGGQVLRMGPGTFNPNATQPWEAGAPAPSGGYYNFPNAPKRRGRRMNVANVKALRRSIRRVKGFAKIARASLVLEKKVKIRKGRR